ncbi:TPA: hypothetical protein N0F65_008620 [Lagenidium giganteum]|uniref:Enoyl-CoA hydratase n=1 Tax=Lagenidium giganteum TaxID=4803 RepID=A0AAV2YXS6_9STRA|nr:TPA: hypothetical protein N0F65_008620 [Lagenidium giganteum]
MATTDDVVKRYVHGKHVLVAQLNRPRRKNAFNDAVYQQLIKAFKELDENPELHALVITGTGDYFTSGADIKESMDAMAAGESRGLPSHGWPPKAMEAFLRCKKLVVAAVNGPAVGIGVTLLLHCDFVYAVDTATFWTPFMRIGIVPEFASSYTFPHMLGTHMANELLIKSRQICVHEALACGLVGHVRPAANFLAGVLEDTLKLVANQYTAGSIPAYKRLLKRQAAPAIREAIAVEFEELDRRFASGEMHEIAMASMADFMSNSKSKL